LFITGQRLRRGLRRLAGSRGGRGSHLCPLRRWGRGKGRTMSRRKHRDDGGKRSRRPVTLLLKHVLGRALESQRTKGDCREAMKTKGKFYFSATHRNLTTLQINTNTAQTV
jgi:hypothetical protein